MTIPAQHGHPERDALVNISWSQVAIQPPVDGTALHMMQVKASLVRVWEPEPPEGVEALEWILVTSVTVNTAEDAWRRVMWYKWRWFVQDFHKVLKTGCLLEDRCLQTVDAMCNLLAILTPTAMRLLWLRQTAQTAPQYCSIKNTSSLRGRKKGKERRQRGSPDGILKPSSVRIKGGHASW